MATTRTLPSDGKTDRPRSSAQPSRRRRSAIHLYDLYVRARTDRRRWVLREHLLAVALTEGAQRTAAMEFLRRMGITLTLTPHGARIALPGRLGGSPPAP
ncbi:hypothetical protein [Azospirillum thermophilum]|uniref:Uncharacterized protein n=1 Tax=Azospirillum thermophilum TaxID=2202148 RepID=A0A2S2CY89_9PROT|nr:hypothetical protein [Azospirillum thermophilum]AWK89484.1 hypothetical protein DEW08_26030 [Azospirillum thermophilum]